MTLIYNEAFHMNMQLDQKIVSTDKGSINAIIFSNTCPYCGNDFEYGMVHIDELSGYYRLMLNGLPTWKAGSTDRFSVDTSKQVFMDYAGSHNFCSILCEKIYHYLIVKARNINNSTKRRKEKRDAVRALIPAPICKICQQPFKSKRSDALYCSDTCRQRAHRRKSG